MDYISSLSQDQLLAGSTHGQVCIYDTYTTELTAQLDTDGLSIYEMAYEPQTKRLAIGCDDGQVYVYDMDDYKKVSDVRCQQSDITSMLYLTTDRLVVG